MCYLPNTLSYNRQSADQSPSTFSELLKYSLFRPDTHKATCQHCKQFSTFTSTRSIASRRLPPILAVNASIYNNESLNIWREMRGSHFMTPQFPLRGQVNGMDDSEEILYQVRVCYIIYDIYIFLTMTQALILKVVGKGPMSHLVAIIKGKDLPHSHLIDLFDIFFSSRGGKPHFIESMVLIQ